MRYYFDFIGSVVYPDLAGKDLPDDAAAIREAESRATFYRRALTSHDGKFIRIRDEKDRVVSELQISKRKD